MTSDEVTKFFGNIPVKARLEANKATREIELKLGFSVVVTYRVPADRTPIVEDLRAARAEMISKLLAAANELSSAE